MTFKKGHIVTKEIRNKISEAQLGEKNHLYGKHHSKKTREKMSLSHMKKPGYWKEKHFTKEHKNKISESLSGEKNYLYGKHLTEAAKQKIGEANKGKIPPNKGKKGLQVAWNKGKKGLQVPWNKGKTGYKCIPSTEETRQKLRIKALKQFENGMPEETRDKIRNTLIDWDFYNEHGCTRRQYPYPSEFYEQRPIIAERDNCTCQMCNEMLPDKWGTHHIDYDKDNNSEYNLIFLCNYCHGKTNHNRAFWEQYFTELQIARGFGESQDNISQTVIENRT